MNILEQLSSYLTEKCLRLPALKNMSLSIFHNPLENLKLSQLQGYQYHALDLCWHITHVAK
jgi:hypothetical protein